MINHRVLLDTGPIVALLDNMDAQHRRCVDVFAALMPPLVTCWPVLTEAAWILRKKLRPLDHIAKLHDSGLIALSPLDGESLSAIAATMGCYDGVQLADAALLHLAERENIHTVFTFDRRDFSIMRLKHNRPLTLIPDIQ